MTSEALAGTGLMQSPQEWETRNRVLAESMSALINRFAAADLGEGDRGIDVGCQAGALTDAMQLQTPFDWTGIDPTISEPRRSGLGLELLRRHRRRAAVPGGDIQGRTVRKRLRARPPGPARGEPQRDQAGADARGLRGGTDPNPYFPIESHSRLPFMGWLPMRAQKAYWRLSPVPGSTTSSSRCASRDRAPSASGTGSVYTSNSTIRPRSSAGPEGGRTGVERPMRLLPWAWQSCSSVWTVLPRCPSARGCNAGVPTAAVPERRPVG